MVLHVELVVPEGEVWAGAAGLVIAKTLDGDIGVMAGRAPVLGILAEGSVVRILPRYGGAGHDDDSGGDSPAVHDGGPGADEVTAAVSGGFFSVADDRVSILARQAQLGSAVDQPATRAALEAAVAAEQAPGEQESADVRYLRAMLRAAGAGDGTS
jgi:F-type H+-transporting ATPase subunit epsilon